jgi:hypothetical protein
VDQGYLGRNREQRERLRHLLEGVDEAALARPTGTGWTVATVLAHLAFWDRFALARLDAFERTGQFPGAVDADMLNAAGEAEWQALAPHTAAQLALRAMNELDDRIEGLSSASVEAVRTSGRDRLLDRASHRLEHIDQIEPVLRPVT